MSLEGPIQLPNEREILLDIGDEHPRLRMADKASAANAALSIRHEFAQAVDLYRGAPFQSLAEKAGDAALEGCF
jgi:hypothetical protein